MKRKLLGLLVITGLLVMISCEKKPGDQPIQDLSEELTSSFPSSDEIIPGQYIVVLKKSLLKSALPDNASYQEKQSEVEQVAKSLFTKKSTGNEIIQVYAETMKAFAAKIADEDVAGLENQEMVDYVVPDRMFILRPPWENPDPDPDPAGQEVPYGIERVGTANGTGKTAWIIDTGIDLDHPDLNVDQTRGRNFIRTSSLPDDDNGHGSHCAGIVAAIDNEFGVVGVAAGATVVPVKVLDRRGSGAYSGIIAGIDYVASAAAPGDAVNMSLGGSAYDPIDEAVLNASEKGIFFALAAGNESTDAGLKSPARVNGTYIFTISAMDVNDNWAYFSNYNNPPVDYCEPGVNIYSTYKKGGYTSMSGTSMAAPHMCGILLMTNGAPKTDGTVNNDPDDTPDPIGTL